MEGGYILCSKNMGVWVGGASEVSLPHMAASLSVMGQYIFPLTQACPIWEQSALRQFLIQAHRCSAQNFHGERASIF